MNKCVHGYVPARNYQLFCPTGVLPTHTDCWGVWKPPVDPWGVDTSPCIISVTFSGFQCARQNCVERGESPSPLVFLPLRLTCLSQGISARGTNTRVPRARLLSVKARCYRGRPSRGPFSSIFSALCSPQLRCPSTSGRDEAGRPRRASRERAPAWGCLSTLVSLGRDTASGGSFVCWLLNLP